MLASGWTQASVRRFWNIALDPTGETEFFSKNNISTHARRHLSSSDQAVRQIWEERARQEGLDIESEHTFLLTKTAALQNLAYKALEQLNAGTLEIKGADLISAIKTLAELEASQSGLAEDEMLREMRAFADAVRLNVPEELWDKIYEDFLRLADTGPRAIMPATVDAEEIIEYDDDEEEEDDGSE